jgi:hypothetical protein
MVQVGTDVMHFLPLPYFGYHYPEDAGNTSLQNVVKTQRKTLHGAKPQNTTFTYDLSSNVTGMRNSYFVFGFAKIRNGHLKICVRAYCKHMQ